MLTVRPIERQLVDIRRSQTQDNERRQQNAVSHSIDQVATVGIITNALATSRAASGSSRSETEKLQDLKANTLNQTREAIQAGETITANDVRNIGRFVSSILPSGGIGASLDQNDIFGRGAISRFGGRTGGTNTVDTHEHFRVSRELRRLKLEALQVRLDTEASETEAYRQMRNRELIEHNVRIQTLPLAVGRK
jgi:hypothetical protein